MVVDDSKLGDPKTRATMTAGIPPEERAEIGDDRRDRDPHAEQDGVAHAEEI